LIIIRDLSSGVIVVYEKLKYILLSNDGLRGKNQRLKLKNKSKPSTSFLLKTPQKNILLVKKNIIRCETQSTQEEGGSTFRCSQTISRISLNRNGLIKKSIAPNCLATIRSC